MRYRWSYGSCALTAVILGITLTACSGNMDEEAADNAAPEPGAADAMRAELGGHPDFNGIWRAVNSANWNLESHPASALKKFWQLGAFGAIPAGQSVVVGGKIPYLPEAEAMRDEFRENWPDSDPETMCFLPGIPRATYMPYSFQIVQGDGDILFVYEYHSTNRLVAMEEHREPPVDTWMGQSNGEWDGDTLVIDTYGFNGKEHLDRSGNFLSRNARVQEKFTLMDPEHIWYEATITDPTLFSAPWTIEMPLYKIVDKNAQLLEFKCVPFVEDLRYHDLIETGPGADESQ